MKMFGPKHEEIKGWRKINYKKRYNFYSSLIILRIIRSRRMRWARYAASIEK